MRVLTGAVLGCSTAYGHTQKALDPQCFCSVDRVRKIEKSKRISRTCADKSSSIFAAIFRLVYQVAFFKGFHDNTPTLGLSKSDTLGKHLLICIQQEPFSILQIG